MRAAELEREVEALRARAEAAARDGSVRSEARVSEATARAEAAARLRADSDARATQAEARAKDAERKLADVTARAADLESRGRDADARAREAEARATSGETRRREVEARLKALETSARDAEAKAAAELRARGAVEMKAAELEKVVQAAERRAKQRADDEATQADLEAEVNALEAALRERGHEVNRLKAEIRVAEQVGKELLFELETARPDGVGVPTSGAGSIGGGGALGGAGSLGGSGGNAEPPAAGKLSAAELDELSERTARAEADLVASAWRVTQLERELARQSSPATPSARERELEGALALAQRELAEARSAQLDPGQRVAPSVSAGSTEPLVLLEQVARAHGNPSDSSTP